MNEREGRNIRKRQKIEEWKEKKRKFKDVVRGIKNLKMNKRAERGE
jgi:hypothetical protein